MEHLKRFNDMSADEKTAYVAQVQKWQTEDFADLCKKSEAWTEADVKSFEEGLKLLSAFSKFDQFIHDAEVRKDYRRRMNHLQYYLGVVRKDTGMDKVATRSASDTTQHYAAKNDTKTPKPKAQTAAELEATATALLGERPDHISEYEKLLSPALQMRVAEISTLRASYAADAEMAKRLAEKNASKKEIAEYSSRAVETKAVLDGIYADIDTEIAALKAATATTDNAAEAQPAEAEETAVATKKTTTKKASTKKTTKKATAEAETAEPTETTNTDTTQTQD